MGKKLLSGKIFDENCMKMKEIGPRGGARPWPPPPPPPDPPNDFVVKFYIYKKKAFDTLPLLSGGRIPEYDFLPARHDVVYFRTVSGVFVQVTVVVHYVLK